MDCNIDQVLKDEKWKELLQIAKEGLTNDKTGHDYEHTIRVLKNALLISKSYKVDYDILIASCLLHDIAYRNGRVKDHHLVGAKIAEEVLDKLNFPKGKIKKVAIAIEDHVAHMVVAIRKNEDLQIESKILRDCDNIDAVGSIGLIRMISFSLSQNIPYFKSKEDRLDETLYGNIKFLLSWPSKMLTFEGEKLGEERVNILNEFLEQLEKEAYP